MLSYWEKASLLHYDYIVVGAGIVGISTAIFLKKKAPQADVLVLERSLLPDGASTKNAGFACIGSLSEVLDDLEHMMPEEVQQLVAKRLKGLHQLRLLLGDEAIAYRTDGSFEIIPPYLSDTLLSKISSINALLLPVTDELAFAESAFKPKDFGFHPQFAQVLIENRLEGSIHTGKMVKALIRLANALGVEIKFGASVSHIEPGANVQVHCNAGTSPTTYTFTCRKLALCTNAFARQFMAEADITPGRGLVLVTKPLPVLPFKGIFHFDKGYYYFRALDDNRVLLGGGRNLDKAGETTTTHGINARIFDALKYMLQEQILPGQNAEIDMVWSGIMAFGKTKQPIVKKVYQNIVAGVRMGGMGVAIGCGVGEEVAALMME
jgi:glycine/D-amino acid oxidase-like deaminating enzyme